VRLKGALAARAVGAVQAVPRALTGPMASVLGGLLFLTVERRATLSNLARVYPEWPGSRRWKVAYDAYRQTTHSLIEFLHGHRYTDAEILDRVAIDPAAEALVAGAMAGGRGALLLTGHFGNWEWLARRAAAGGYPIAVIFKSPRDPALAGKLREIHAIQGFHPIEHGDTRAALRWLRNGGMLGIVMDQEPPRLEEGAIVPLLGRPTLTHVGPFRLARLTGAPVFTAFARRVGRGRHEVRVDPFELSEDPDPDRALTQDAARFNARLEAEIRENPDQWLWMYGRWRRLERMQEARARV